MNILFLFFIKVFEKSYKQETFNQLLHTYKAKILVTVLVLQMWAIMKNPRNNILEQWNILV